MLGPLPPLYRWGVALLALVSCAGLGAWGAWTLPIPLVAPTGALVGGTVGLLVVALLLREHEGTRRPR